MTLELARTIVTEERDCPFGRLAFAAAILSSPEHDHDVTLRELVECLKRGNQFGKVTAIDEPVALALYRRTHRRRQPGLPYEDFVTEAADWEAYLREHGFL